MPPAGQADQSRSRSEYIHRLAHGGYESKGLARIFGGNARHAREVAEAQARFDAAMKTHAQAEADRKQALTNAKVAYDLQVVADPVALAGDAVSR
jgi:hypothetical protein